MENSIKRMFFLLKASLSMLTDSVTFEGSLVVDVSRLLGLDKACCKHSYEIDIENLMFGLRQIISSVREFQLPDINHLNVL